MKQKVNDEILLFAQDLIKIRTEPQNMDLLNEALHLCAEKLKTLTIDRYERNGIKSLLIHNQKGRHKSFKIILNGHLDVIPGKAYQYNPKITNNRLYGVGALDMKSNLSVLIHIFRDMASRVPYPLGLQIVTDEETGGFDGTKYQIEQGVRSEFVISGETTGFNIVNRAKGIIWCEAYFRGKTAHGAYPWRGNNAIKKMNRFIDELLNLYPVPNSQQLVSTVNVAKVTTTNRSFNKIPDDATASFDIRFIPGEDERIIEQIHRLLPEDATLKIITHENALNVSPENQYIKLLQTSVESIRNEDSSLYCAQGSSDARHFAAIGCEGIEFGPIGGGIGEDQEWIDINSLDDYYNILAHFLESLS